MPRASKHGSAHEHRDLPAEAHGADPSASNSGPDGAQVNVSLDAPVLALLNQLSPSGALQEIVDGNPELDRLIAKAEADERALEHLSDPSLVDRLENDFASCVPALADAAVPLENWAIPLLSALAGPCAPLLSFGLTIAVKVALTALKSWAARRLATPPPAG